MRYAVHVSVRSCGGGADRRGQLGLDQGPGRSFGCLSHPVTNLGDRECLQHLEQGRLVQGHRVSCPSTRTLVGLADRHTAAPSTRSPTPSEPRTYTTPWDMTAAGPAPGPRSRRADLTQPTLAGRPFPMSHIWIGAATLTLPASPRPAALWSLTASHCAPTLQDRQYPACAAVPSRAVASPEFHRRRGSAGSIWTE